MKQAIKAMDVDDNIKKGSFETRCMRRDSRELLPK
jgi:hypothetical protein